MVLLHAPGYAQRDLGQQPPEPRVGVALALAGGYQRVGVGAQARLAAYQALQSLAHARVGAQLLGREAAEREQRKLVQEGVVAERAGRFGSLGSGERGAKQRAAVGGQPRQRAGKLAARDGGAYRAGRADRAQLMPVVIAGAHDGQQLKRMPEPRVGLGVFQRQREVGPVQRPGVQAQRVRRRLRPRPRIA